MSLLRLGIAGLGTVGQSVVEIITANGSLLERRAGRRIIIAAVSARDRLKSRSIGLESIDWEDDPVALAQRPDVDLLVEVIGGETGPALDAVKAALNCGKDVVTANKAMIALHGQELAELAERRNCNLQFEAAVAGGIPVVKAVVESLAANRISSIAGVLNGTCNYILTRMEQEGKTYDEVFAEADALGYLEADPTLDVGGLDAGHKLAILASIAFGTQVDFQGVDIEGIERISIVDIEQARDIGYRIKLLCIARWTDSGIEQRTQPCLVPVNSPLAGVEGPMNIVAINADPVGQIVLQGPGAGGGPTGSAIVSDIIDIARGRRVPTFGRSALRLIKADPAQSAMPVPYYIRLLLMDRPGVLARVAGALGDAGVSIDRMRQYRHESNKAPVIIITHETTRQQLQVALKDFSDPEISASPPVVIRIEQA